MDNFKISDQLIFPNNEIVNDKSSKKLIGQVTINEYDKDKNLISTEIGHNEIVLPGSVFTLEKLFNIKASGEFLHPTKINLGDSITVTLDETQRHTASAMSLKKIFGFMIGNGGSGSSGVLSGPYTTDSLKSTNAMSCIPFRIISGQAPDKTLNKDYAMGGTDNTQSNYYYFAKKFSGDVTISTTTVDGSQTSITDISDITSSGGVVTYAEAKMVISADDVRAYYSASNSGAVISQVGLVAGFPYSPNDPPVTNDPEMQYSDIRLITAYNFKERDFNNPGNTLEMIYRVYCV